MIDLGSGGGIDVFLAAKKVSKHRKAKRINDGIESQKYSNGGNQWFISYGI